MCDPINRNYDGYAQIISKVYKGGESPELFREPAKYLLLSNYYSGNLTALSDNPAQHSYLVSLSLAVASQGSRLFKEVADARARVGEAFKNSRSALLYKYMITDHTTTLRDSTVYHYLQYKYDFTVA